MPVPIFPEPINHHETMEFERDGKIEKYATFFRHRQAYVCLPLNHPWVLMDDDEIPALCHGGITYSKNKLSGSDEKDCWFIGWDYNHCCSMEDMVSGISYGKVYDISSQQKIKEEAKSVMLEAIEAMKSKTK